MKKIQYILVFILAIAIIPACSKYEDPGPGMMDKMYHVKTDGIALPVRVAGNENSDVALIMTHGGPGGSSQTFRFTEGIRGMEEDYKVIYWDQRASGMTQGNPPKSEITIEQYAEDLDAIVEFTRQVVGAKKIFLLGHSWGGGLTAFYLTQDPSRQQKLSGYVIVCGAYNVPGGLSASRQWILNGAAASIARNKDVGYWQKAIEFYKTNTAITADNFIEHATYLGKLNGGIYNKKLTKLKSYIPAIEISAFLSNPLFVGHNITYKGKSVYTDLDLTNELYKIKLPSFVMWGTHDGLLPAHKIPGDTKGTALADDFIAKVGTDSKDVYYMEYTNSAHEPMAEEGIKFAKDLKLFMNKYK
ncbi:MAG TPA: alpha/beta hydrolase [Chitinophagales bacterium]|nr:alpha/beta hydrolase [Chitinophagales bacterium]